MCGFVASFGELRSWKNGLLAHRGPDQTFFEQGDNFAIEFHRLAITGGEVGRVPVSSASGRWEVYLNGEVYNFGDLVRKWGVRTSPSDTQVVADGLDKLGLLALRDLRGMFAGLIREKDSGAWYVFRDALGEKPVFWSRNAGGIQVASEATALAQLMGPQFALNLDGVADFFRFGYVEEPKTMYAGVHSVGRGGVWLIDTHNQNLVRQGDLQGFDEHETSATLRELITTVSKEQTVTSVQASVALSGGLDSTGVLAAVAGNPQQPSRPIAISVDIPEVPKHSEFRYARRAAWLHGLRVERVVISRDSLPASLMAVGIRSDQPIGDASAVNYMHIFERAHQIGAKVCFLGHGPDEFFWGYAQLHAQLQSSLEQGVHNQFGNNSYWNLSSFPALKSPDEDHGIGPVRNFESADRFLDEENPFLRSRAFVVHSYLSHNGFSQSDRLAMSYGIEPRTPFGDSRLYGWAATNASANQDRALNKTVFRNALSPWVRAIVIRRPKKPFFSLLSRENLLSVPRSDRFPRISLADIENLESMKSLVLIQPSEARLKKWAMFNSWLEGRVERGLVWNGTFR